MRKYIDLINELQQPAIGSGYPIGTGEGDGSGPYHWVRLNSLDEWEDAAEQVGARNIGLMSGEHDLYYTLKKGNEPVLMALATFDDDNLPEHTNFAVGGKADHVIALLPENKTTNPYFYWEGEAGTQSPFFRPFVDQLLAILKPAFIRYLHDIEASGYYEQELASWDDNHPGASISPHNYL